MSEFPDFSDYGYKIITPLANNHEGGRITWKAEAISSNTEVVIKQFCFAKTDSDWSDYKAHLREIQLLKSLHHKSIPRYIDSFETTNGFCLVQEYKAATPLSKKDNFSVSEIKTIALKTLEILVDLQSQTPPIVHRDLKPENILVDANLNVYLVDFGLARMGTASVEASSIFAGTPGFMPPEQIYGDVTTASDLYGLGVTLICLLTGIKSGQVQQLMTQDNPYKLQFRHQMPAVNPSLIRWLEKMVQPQPDKRYPHAAAAKEALEAIDPTPVNQSSSIVKFIQQSRPYWVITATLATIIGAIAFTQFTLSSAAILTIAVGLAVVSIAQIGAIELIYTDQQGKKAAFTLAVATPTVIVFTIGLIAGKTSAVIMSTAIAPLEIIMIAYALMRRFET